jgi:hypothetical protein
MSVIDEIPGYAFGAPELARSPVSLEDLEDLQTAIGFTADDEAALRELGDLLRDRREELFGRWIGLVGHFFVPTFAGPDGTPNQAYLDAAHPRFMQWIDDACTRPYDQAWLDYQHEIALRHHRTKKNQTDGVTSVALVPFRYLPITIYPMATTLAPFLAEAGVAPDRAERLADAWMKSLILHVTLWSYPYVQEGDW